MLLRRRTSRQAASALSVSRAPQATAQDEQADRPSILLIVTDDQRWDTLWAMPEVQRSLVQPGITFSEAFTTSSLCCPSRASILTGQYPHNHGVLRGSEKHWGFGLFRELGNETSTIATWLSEAGYRTGYFGKYLNGYPEKDDPTHVPPRISPVSGLAINFTKPSSASMIIDLISPTLSWMNRHSPEMPSVTSTLNTSAAVSSPFTSGSPRMATARARTLA